MALLNRQERRLALIVSRLVQTNPFGPEWLDLEREVLGRAFQSVGRCHVWDPEQPEHPNLTAISHRAEELVERLRKRLQRGAVPSPQDQLLYQDVALYVLYRRYRHDFDAMIAAALADRAVDQAEFWPAFRRRFDELLPEIVVPCRPAPEHLFASFFQIRRAFAFIFRFIMGTSRAAMRLRADVWSSIFTCNIRRYLRSLYHQMRRLNTLIVGPSGTGKELVARAIGLSQYVPFEAQQGRFAVNFADSFHAINLSAMPPTLIESELFGHKRGAFTDASRDHQGWLGACGSYGSVFLDEISELNLPLQVKLLRLLETREFHRVGDTQTYPFRGKFLAATHRDLPLEISRGRFRQDLYYRLCSDVIVTPSLREQLAECPEDLHDLLLFIARPVVGEEAEVLAEEVEQWTAKHLGRDYPWPGNIRELEQCVRNILVRRDYRPLRLPVGPSGATLPERLTAVFQQGWPTIGELVDEYIRVVYERTGSYEEAAKMLGCNWRTVKSRIDRAHVGDGSPGAVAFPPHAVSAGRRARCAAGGTRGPAP